MSEYRFKEFYIPARMMDGITRYIEKGVPPGDFQTAIIENNLEAACGRADEENLRNIPAYVAYFYNNAPANCWGYKGAVEAWGEKRNPPVDE